MTHTRPSRFAANLRHLCARKASIAAVCREIGFNRQQFNKYLSGAIEPSAQNARRIADYFGIDEFSLHHGELASGAIGAGEGVPGAWPFPTWVRRAARSQPLRPGVYFCYSAVGGQSDHFVRSVLLVGRAGEMTKVSALFTLNGSRARGAVRLRSKGVAIDGGAEIAFLLYDRGGKGGPTVLRLHPVGDGGETFLGIGIFNFPAAGAVAARVTVAYAGTSRVLREAIAQSGIRRFSEPGLDPFVRRSLEAGPEILRPFDVLGENLDAG